MLVATESCCGLDWGWGKTATGFFSSGKMERPCKYYRERLTYNGNAERCEEEGGFHCDPDEYLNYRSE